MKYGFGGSYVYRTATYTSTSKFAVPDFVLAQDTDSFPRFDDLASGTRTYRHRYIVPCYGSDTLLDMRQHGLDVMPVQIMRLSSGVRRSGSRRWRGNYRQSGGIR